MTSRTRPVLPTRVYLEVGKRRCFACALDWPGWARSGKGEDAALEALASYASRYAPVVAGAGLRFPKGAADTFDVVERVPGSATTDFGAPGGVPAADTEPVDTREARRLAALVEAGWRTLDQVVAGAPASLRKGPRGGGRDRDAIAAHVVDAEVAYARKLGLRLQGYAADDEDAVAAARAQILAVLASPSDGTPPDPKHWPTRYGARRIAWHVLDHAWEIEDRTDG